MKSKLLCLTMVLSASLSASTAGATQTSIPVYQSNSQIKANQFSEGESQERSYIDTADHEQKTTSKSEKKRSSAGGTFLSVLCIIFIAVAIYLGSGDWDGLM
ncbi:MAG: hypothetical protein VKN72_02565 [Nostocales cyanobacterium 94392]|nr:hypothetical protein [Nostocales cyanobacterium 94392]